MNRALAEGRHQRGVRAAGVRRAIAAFFEAAGDQLAADGGIVVAVALAAAVEFQQHAAQRWGVQGVLSAVQHFGFKTFHVDFSMSGVRPAKASSRVVIATVSVRAPAAGSVTM